MKTPALLLLPFTISALILGTTASTSPVSDAYAQNDPAILERIALQADGQILNQLERVYGDSVPPAVQSAYDRGHLAVESLIDSLAAGNVERAKEDFLTAMKSFKQITRMTSESVAEARLAAPSDDGGGGNSDRDLQSELNRLIKHVNKIRDVSQNHNTGINFDKIDGLIDQAHHEITSGTGDPSGTMDQLKRLIDSVKKNIHEHASHDAPDRVKQFVSKQLDNIERKLSGASDAGADPSQVSRAYEIITKIKSLMSEHDDVDNARMALHDLVDLVKRIESSVG